MRPEALAATHRAAFTLSRAWTALEFEALLAQPRILLAGDDRAFGLIRVVADEAELLTIATHPDHQRKGHARAILDCCHTLAQARGARHVFLEVAADNTAACALYAAMGYRQTSLRKDYYPRNDSTAADALIMTHDLTCG
ncbi:GNAT family N-acetyltransferase [Aestuariivita sp.]|jgi:ribosomal-protein-alanine N-acetyltransferase|uniref:GNAT family N-acetyltransferase n=1 Tax=Aestuariivita sp. TaxID=1872407 RepID=UPI002170837C|nr:GNAT family N-acetyltransferase [Aestuariivita sp.]MCE8007258.1 GNAT family N-acetyltransferase [Aestuariivita sp.]